MAWIVFLSILAGDALDEARMAIDKKEFAKARTLLTPLAEDNNVDAQLLLAGLCERDKDRAAAIRWYKRAADLNAPKAHYRLGLLTTSKDVAERHWRKAVQAGHIDAKYRLGALLVDRGDESGWRYLEEAGLAYNLEARLRIIRQVYDHKDLRFKVPVGQWVIEAAEAGHPEGQYRASFLVGTEEERLAWLRKSAAQGHAKAQLRLGQRLVRAKKYKEAEAWLLKAVKQAEPEAAYELHGVNMRLRRGYAAWYGWLLTAARMDKALRVWDLATRERRATYVRVQGVGRNRDIKGAKKKAAEYWKLVEPGVKAKK